jgi:hypothetical protein
MSEKQVFPPPKRTGILLHALILLLLLGGITSLLFLAFARTTGGLLPLLILGVLVLLALLPVAAYRGYALLHARYEVERDGLRVRWGLRSEDIPLTEVMDVRTAGDLPIPLRLPFFAFPGAILGAVEHEDLGHVEFLASQKANFVIVSTVDETLVLSPEDPQDFVRRFDRLIEMGSLTPINAHTSLPAVYLRQLLNDRLSRLLILLGLGLTVVLMILSSVLVSLRSEESSRRLLLQSIISLFFTVVDLVGGAFYYRKEETRVISYALWAASAFAAVLLLAGLLLAFFSPAN